MEQSLISLKKIFKGSKKTTFFIVLAMLGIIFIVLGGFNGNTSASEAAVPKQSDTEYCEQLEIKIKELVTAITGNESCVVAVTLENSGEYIYADQNKVDLNQTEDKATDTTTTKESRKSEQEYIINNLIQCWKPDVRGVAIVARGINNMNYDLISSCISSMLGIPSRKISISEAS